MRGAQRLVELGDVFDDLDRLEAVIAVERGQRLAHLAAAQAGPLFEADAGRVRRIEAIEIDGDAVADRAARHDRERFLHDRVETAPAHFLHEEDAHAEALEKLDLARLEGARADITEMLGPERGAAD